jgi:hypothetical protein
MPQRPGRPRTNLKQKILAEMSENDERFEAIVGERLGSLAASPWRMAFEAACLRWTLEKGTAFKIARCESLIKKLRKTKWGRANDPRERLSDRGFLDRFIEAHAPGFDWRKDARQGEIEDRIREQDDEQFAQEHAEDVRRHMACTSKFFPPDVPDAFLMWRLAWESRRSHRNRRRVIRRTRRTWPTLRELKLATAIDERIIKKIIKRLQPKKGEILREPLRNKFAKRGAIPLRYGPRLVIGVLNEFVNRLRGFALEEEEQKGLRKTAFLVKRAFAARLGRSRQST